MAKASLRRAEYDDEAAAKGLRFIGMITPKSVYDTTTWECLACGRVMEKSYRAVLYGRFGCRCQNTQTLGGKKYNQLAKRLGILWTPDKHPKSDNIVLPSNTKTATKWTNPMKGVPVLATYHQLAYGRIPNEIALALGIDPEINLKEKEMA